MRIYNTMSGQEEEFQPIGDPVKMYVCGVTPYDSSHIGHAMSYINFDAIRRYLEFRGYNVYMVQNFTDVDDKLIARANRLGVSVKDLAEKHIAEFIGDMVTLNVRPPSLYVRATDTIPTIVEFTSGLINKGYAYAVGGDVYFRISADDDYGKLSHRNLDDMEAGARVDVDEQKEHPMDFALWKSAKAGEPSWDSPWGKGRPGWHIECSAMILKHLGPQIDIHGGGHDLIFPHHENEIAQSESYTGCKPFVKYWIHNGLLQLGKEKMSKSLGNLVSIKEALEKASPDGLRMLFLTSHYRGPLTYTDEGLAAAERGAERLRTAVSGLTTQPVGEPTGPLADAVARAREQFVKAMDDDFNCASAISALFDLARDINRATEGGASIAETAPAKKALKTLCGVLGFTLEEPSSDLAAKPFIDLLVDVRTELRALKQWALADKVRNRLNELGVVIEDRADGSIWKTSRAR